MNKLRILMVAMVLAALIAAALLFVPGLKGSGVARVLYMPAVLLALLFSGGDHSPSATAWNSAFAAYSITYLFLVVVVYALLLEAYLLVRTTWSMVWPEQVVDVLPSEFADEGHPAGNVGFATARTERVPSGRNSQAQALAASLGRSLQAHERRRRSHWLLAPREIDLSAAPADAAKEALDTQAAPRATAWMLHRLEIHGKAALGANQARRAMERTFRMRR